MSVFVRISYFFQGVTYRCARTSRRRRGRGTIPRRWWLEIDVSPPSKVFDRLSENVLEH
jgi:hypothetical protein